MDLIVPSYKLPRENVFNFRQKEFQDAKIVSTIQEMLKCAEKYDIILQKISLSSRKKPDQAEIKKTISRTLKISLSIKGGTKEIELKYEILGFKVITFTLVVIGKFLFIRCLINL